MNAACSDCERGYYKLDSVDTRFEPCTQCSGDKITDGPGKTSPDDCIIRKYKYSGLKVTKLFFMLNSTKHESLTVHKC